MLKHILGFSLSLVSVLLAQSLTFRSKVYQDGSQYYKFRSKFLNEDGSVTLSVLEVVHPTELLKRLVIDENSNLDHVCKLYGMDQHVPNTLGTYPLEDHYEKDSVKVNDQGEGVQNPTSKYVYGISSLTCWPEEKIKLQKVPALKKSLGGGISEIHDPTFQFAGRARPISKLSSVQGVCHKFNLNVTQAPLMDFGKIHAEDVLVILNNQGQFYDFDRSPNRLKISKIACLEDKWKSLN